VRPELIEIPWDLFDRLKHVVIAADVMFLNGLPFFVTKSRGLNCSLLNISLAGPLLNPVVR
jgi:hypothetical protein